MQIKLPVGWTTNNPKLKLILEPRKKTNIDVLIFSPEKIEEGKYIGYIEINSEDEKIEKELIIEVGQAQPSKQFSQYIYIQKPLELYIEEIKEKIIPIKEIIFFFAVFVILVLIYITLHKKQKETEFAASAYTELEKLKETIKREIKLP